MLEILKLPLIGEKIENKSESDNNMKIDSKGYRFHKNSKYRDKYKI